METCSSVFKTKQTPFFIANSRRNDPPVCAAAPCELLYCSGSNLVFSKPTAQVALAKQEYHYVNREGNKWGKNRTTHLSDSFLGVSIASKNAAG